MSKSPSLSPSLARARWASRLLFLILIPIGLSLHLCTRELVTGSGLPALAVERPPGWQYLSATGVVPSGDTIRYDGSALEAALSAGQAAPLFAVTKYPHPHSGLNPMIGLNVSVETGAEVPSATALLARSVAEVQARSGNGLVEIEPITATTVAGRPAARVVLESASPPAGTLPDRMVVIALLEGRTSFMVAASGATAGADDIGAALARFTATLSLTAP